MTDLSQLIKLQEIDAALMELENRKGDLPAKIDELTTGMETIRTSIEENEEHLKKLEIEIRQIRGKESDRKQKMDKLQEQLYLVKTNREYDALMSEIDHLKEEIDEEELRELELSEEKDRLGEQLKLDRLEGERMKSELGVRKGELEKTVASTEKEFGALMSERQKLLPSIDVRHAAVYDRVRSARGGIAVVPVEDHACGGCHSRLTSQSIVEIRNGNTIAQCPACRRILYWPHD
ncbi:MAG: zinc ribbon domain-containing protein [Fidelibacterota bacterium]